MTPEQVQDGLREIMSKYRLAYVSCAMSQISGPNWILTHINGSMQHGKDFHKIADLRERDWKAQAEMEQYMLRAGA